MPSKIDFGRIPVTIVQIDQDLCCLAWKGTTACGTCNATGLTPCFNTFNTCQSTADYTLGDPLTLSFAKPHSDLPDEVYIIPSIVSISTTPGRINVGGRNGKDKPLGRRAQLTVTFQDHPHSDNFVDPYLTSRTYDPFVSGTFWSKWLKRNPYYQGRSLRLYEGYYGQTLAEMKIRHYVIDSITIPDSKGNVTLKAKDILTLADDKKAQAPRLSSGVLYSSIGSADTTLMVSGDIIGNYTSYPTKIIRIGEELIRYTSVTTDVNGNLVFTGLSRGSESTPATEHDSGDTVQACLEYDNIRPDIAAYDLLSNYSNMSTTLIDNVGFASEGDTWLLTYKVKRIITEPTGLTQLLGELCEQTLMYIWWDEYSNLVRLKVLHPPTDVVPLYTEEGNLLQNSVSLKTDNSLISSEIWASYTPINPINIKDKKDYKRTKAVIDPVLESSFAFGERKVYDLVCAWVQSDAIISQLINNLLLRYSTAPIFISFSLDAKDNDLVMGDVFDLLYSGFVDETGQKEIVRYQIISSHEIDGSVVKYEAQKFDYSIDTRVGYWMVNTAPDYSTASDSEKLNGAFWADDDGLLFGDPGYVYI